MAARPKIDEYHHRMSCVNSSDILRSARNALNQYPRFSLDGKDAMYRSSFRNFDRVTSSIRNRRSVETSGGWCLPAKVAGERVIWCKPGVVGKLMGLEAMPIPIRLKHRTNASLLRKQNLRRTSDRQEIERRKVESNRGGVSSSCSRAANGYCVLKPVAVEITAARDDEVESVGYGDEFVTLTSLKDNKGAENPACKGFFIDIFGGGLGSSWSSLILGDEDNLVVEAGRVNEVPKRDPENCKGGCLVVPIGPLTEYGELFERAVAAKGPEKACRLIFLALKAERVSI
nr:hypothetical protein [Tanacetum cinerariifolium]